MDVKIGGKTEVKCTGGGTRTPTPLREVDFESTASTNSATPAIFLQKETGKLLDNFILSQGHGIDKWLKTD